MPASVTALLAAVLLLPGSPARADEAFEGAYLGEIVSALGALDSTREHLEFVKSDGLDLRIVAPEAENLGGFGSYRKLSDEILINAELIEEGRRELAESGFSPAEVAEILAWKTLPIIAHEIRHAMLDRRLKKRRGLTFDIPTVENEAIAYIDEAAVVLDAMKNRRGLWERAPILEIEQPIAYLLKSAEKGVPGVVAFVENSVHYARNPSLLKESRKRLLARWHTVIELSAFERERYRQRLEVKVPDAAERRKKLEEWDARAEPSLKIYRRGRAVVESRDGFKKLRAFYRDEMARMGRKLERVKR